MAASTRRRERREPSTTTDRPAEVVTLQRTFDYLQGCIDVDTVIPVALAKGLITSRQRTKCLAKASVDEKADQFLEYLQRSVKGNCEHFQTFIGILVENGQEKVAERLRG